MEREIDLVTVVDVDLSEKEFRGQKSGQLIKNLNINIDVFYTSLKSHQDLQP